MEIQFAPDVQSRLDQIAQQTGRPAADVVQDAVQSYVDDVSVLRESLDRRYDEVKSGQVQLIPGEEVEGYFAKKIAAARKG